MKNVNEAVVEILAEVQRCGNQNGQRWMADRATIKEILERHFCEPIADLDKLKVDELRDLAESRGIVLDDRAKKAEIIATIEAHNG